MLVSRLQLKNWRNFLAADLRMPDRVFLVGPNAAGKSNLLDALRFLGDIAQPGGGLQKAVEDRGGLSKIRCLAARKHPDIELRLELSDFGSDTVKWSYEIGIKQQPRGDRKPYLAYERVYHEGKVLRSRPGPDDIKDPARLTQTHLEQINSNAEFRDVSRFLDSILYLHLVPQLVKHTREFLGPGIPGDPYGLSFLTRLAQTPERTRTARLKVIETALRLAVPQLKELSYVTDSLEGGVPHLEALYEHWRAYGAKQRETEFSDGTLRLIGLLWSLLEGDSLLLLEEPELSLNGAIVARMAPLIHRMQRRRRRQVIISTHSSDLLSDKGIGPEEVVLLIPGREGTEVKIAAERSEVIALLEGGMSVGEAVAPLTAPTQASQLDLFE
ncbi:MAG TPA: AAA family ATPase [Polyangia bacterium]|jgi:predicted ATPase